MIRNIVNASNDVVVLDDLNGIAIDVGETVDGLQFGIERFKSSASVIKQLMLGTIRLNDGTYDYEGNKAIDLMKDNVDQLTRDGKRIITSSDRPKDHYRHFTSCGDDMVNRVRCTGDQLMFQVPPGETVTKEAQFIDDLYLKDGFIRYENAALGSHITVDIVAPAGVPYPAIFKNGNCDIVNGVLVMNASNTGSYNIDPNAEATFMCFAKQVLIFGTDNYQTSAPEPSFLPTPIIQRFKIYNASTTDTLNAVISMGLYRKQTV